VPHHFPGFGGAKVPVAYVRQGSRSRKRALGIGLVEVLAGSFAVRSCVGIANAHSASLAFIPQPTSCLSSWASATLRPTLTFVNQSVAEKTPDSLGP
jgi:hypothetical protein